MVDNVCQKARGKNRNTYLAKSLCPPTQINSERRWYLFALALALQTLQLVHGTVELPVQVSLVAEKFVDYVRGRQAEPSAFSVNREFLTLHRIFLERGQPFQSVVDNGDNIGVRCFTLGKWVFGSAAPRTTGEAAQREGVVPEAKGGEEFVSKRFGYETVALDLGFRLPQKYAQESRPEPCSRRLLWASWGGT